MNYYFALPTKTRRK